MTGLLYIGSLADDGGITVARRDAGGSLSAAGRTPGAAPSFLAAHPRLPLLYAVHGTAEGSVAAYDVGPDGRLAVRAVHESHGYEPCHLQVAPDGTALAVANYEDGVVCVRSLDPSGTPAEPAVVLRHRGGGPHPERQRGPHAHMCHYDRDGLLHVVDLGGDRVHRYLPGFVAHAAGPIRLRPGSGPRHIAGDGRGHWYVAGELDATVTGLVARDGGWKQVAALPASESAGLTYPSHIALSPDGRFLYVANRGPDTVSVFRAESGRLDRVAEVPAGGRWPRHFAVTGEHLYVAAERSDAVVAFRLRDGVPEPTGAVLAAPAPSCVLPWDRPRSA